MRMSSRTRWGGGGGGGGLVAKTCPTLVTPWTAAHQVLLSMEFSRQEHWNGLPLPSPMGGGQGISANPIQAEADGQTLPAEVCVYVRVCALSMYVRVCALSTYTHSTVNRNPQLCSLPPIFPLIAGNHQQNVILNNSRPGGSCMEHTSAGWG